MTALSNRCRRAVLSAAVLGLLALGGCEKLVQSMYNQPKYTPLAPSPLFANASSARSPVPGTVAARQGAFADASSGLRGQVPSARQTSISVFPILSFGAGGTPPPPKIELPQQVPLALDRATYERGRDQFDAFCSPCHGLLADGNGMVVQRGFPSPPDFNTNRLRTAPDKHFFDAMTQGYGAMYSYADRVAPEDRWAIVAYIRALQLSQYAPLDLLPQDARAALDDHGGAQR